MQSSPVLKPRVRWVLALACWGVPALLAAALAVLRADAMSMREATVLVALASLVVLASRSNSAHASNALLVASTIALVLLWPELALRLSGFRFDTRAVVQFGRPTPDELLHLERDPELFWKLPSSRPDVNRLGFFGPEVLIPKPPRSWRMVFFGDSCTQQGFPAGVPPKLRALAPDGPLFEAVNLGVAGYTSHQGRVIAQRLAHTLQPDVAVVFYGWNDHWQAYGETDSEKARRGFVTPAWLRWLVTHSRIVQWVAKRRASRYSRPLATARVPLPEYKENLEAIGAYVEDAGGRVVLLTAPTSHARLGVPDHLVAEGYAASEANALDWHRRYNEAVRVVSRARGWALLDLEAEVEARSDIGALFTRDGIHFTERGLDWVASEVARVLADVVLPAAVDEVAP